MNHHLHRWTKVKLHIQKNEPSPRCPLQPSGWDLSRNSPLGQQWKLELALGSRWWWPDNQEGKKEIALINQREYVFYSSMLFFTTTFQKKIFTTLKETFIFWKFFLMKINNRIKLSNWTNLLLDSALDRHAKIAPGILLGGSRRGLNFRRVLGDLATRKGTKKEHWSAKENMFFYSIGSFPCSQGLGKRKFSHHSKRHSTFFRELS